MRLTLREQEIINVIKKNPLISQDDLAQMFGITRSSVAVHISNLMKKGIIRGKGYVFNEQASVTIIGECYLKIEVYNQDTVDSVINIEYKGMPVDLSSIFCNYGIKPQVVTFVGKDELGTFFLDKFQNLEIDIANVFKHPTKRSCRRIYINDELAYAENIAWEDYLKALNTKEWVIFNCDWLVVEPRFSEEIAKRASNKKDDKLPHFCTYTILNSINDIPKYLTYYSVVVLGITSINNNPDIINQLLDISMKNKQIFIITDGKAEIIAIDENGVDSFPLLPNQNFDIDNKLSFFLAGLIYGILNKHPLRQAIRIAIGTASVNES